jgi:rod shape-determining protein MreC
VNQLQRYGRLFAIVLLLAVPFFTLRATIKRPEQLSGWERVILRVVAPAEWLGAAIARNFSRAIGSYVYLVDVKADNAALALENARLRGKLRELGAAEAENRRLKKLLALRETVPSETVSAVVVGKDTTEYFRVAHLVLDKPGVAVSPNMPVLGAEGTVGTVLRVAGDNVDVQLTVDSGFGVDVVVERTGARGFVRGTGDRSRYAVRVEYVQRTDEVNEGDLLLTSGVGCRFPKGVPVAKVTKVEKRDFGIYQSVEATPTVDFSRLEEVLVVLTDTKDCDAKTGDSSAKKSRPKK